jgi:hypothetical protein
MPKARADAALWIGMSARFSAPCWELKRVQLADEIAHPQPDQLRTVRHRSEEPELALG